MAVAAPRQTAWMTQISGAEADELVRRSTSSRAGTDKCAALEDLWQIDPTRARGPLKAAIQHAGMYEAMSALKSLAVMNEPWVADVIAMGLQRSEGEARGIALHGLVRKDLAKGLAAARQVQGTWKRYNFAPAGLLARHGDESDVPAVAARVMALAKGRAKDDFLPSELCFLVPMLARHGDHPDGQRAMTTLLANPPQEPETRIWLAANVVFFAGLAETTTPLPAEVATALAGLEVAADEDSDAEAVTAMLLHRGIEAVLLVTWPSVLWDSPDPTVQVDIVRLPGHRLWLVPNTWPPMSGLSVDQRRAYYRAEFTPEEARSRAFRLRGDPAEDTPDSP